MIEWCQTVELDIVGDIDGMYHYVGWKLPVSYGRAKLPCNVYRILDVYIRSGDPGSRIPFNRLPGMISFGNSNISEVYIDYVGLPIDLETGIPLIQVGHEEACAAYCIYMLHYEDGINGKVPGFQMMKADMQHEMLAVIGSRNYQRKTRKDVNDLDAIRYDMTPAAASLGLISGDFVNHNAL